MDEQRLLSQDKGSDIYTGDGSIDTYGKPALRQRTGNWKACSFILGTECCERFAYTGIATNLVTFFTTKLHQGNVSAARSIGIWQGTCYLTPLLGAVLADAYWGRFWTIAAAAFIYLLGLCSLTLSASVPALMPAECVDSVCPVTTAAQSALFLFGLYLVALGTGGIKPCVPPFGADQFDASDPEERVKKGSFFNWYYFTIAIGGVVSSILLVWVQDNLGWGLGFGIPALFMVISIVVFFSGSRSYRFRKPKGSPITRIFQVVVASFRKLNLEVPEDSSLVYEKQEKSSADERNRELQRTDTLKFLDRATFLSVTELESRDFPDPWRLCTVTQVEEVKTLIRLFPIWATGTVMYACIFQDSLFIEQGTMMNTTIGGSFTVSAAAFSNLGIVAILLLVPIYDKIVVPVARKLTGNERGFTQLQRMGIGLFCSVPFLASAAILETVRLRAGQLSILWQAPQYVLAAATQVLAYVGQLEFFYEEAPETMRSLCSALVLLSLSLGFYLSSLVLTVVSGLTGDENGEGGWINDDLNEGRLDYYFWVWDGIGFVNALIYVVFANKFRSKKASILRPHVHVK